MIDAKCKMYFFVADGVGEWFNCQFCALIFSVYDELKAHTFSHFNTKTCSVCNIHLIQICTDWFELHSTSNCHNNNHIHTFNANNGGEPMMMMIKQEPPPNLEADHLDDLLNVKTDVDLSDFGDIFAANLNTGIETNENQDSNPTFPHHSNSNYPSFDDSKYSYEAIHFVETGNSMNVFPRKKRSKGFQCQFCEKIFVSRFRLDCHIQSHHDMQNQTKCKHCHRSFQSFVRLDKHLRQCVRNNRKRAYLKAHPHRPAGNFICDICGSTLKKFRTLIDHMNEKHSSKCSFKCRICGRLYPSRYYLTKHLNRHKQVFSERNDSVIGDLDEDLMERKKYIRVHPHRPQANFTCDICGKAISRFELLEEHMSTSHSAADSFQCRLCGRVYPNRYYLNKHTARHRLNNANDVEEMAEDLDKGLMERNKYNRSDPVTRKIGLTCNECGRVFKHHYLLLEHKSSRHSGKSRFPCRKCGRFYPNRYYLTKHLKRHEEAEQMGVPEEQLFGDLDDGLMERNKYIRPEPNEKEKTEFECQECGIVFKKFFLLTEHKRAKHSDENGFPCRKCGRSYPNRYYLAKHLKRHENETETEMITVDDNESLDKIDLIEDSLVGEEKNVIERMHSAQDHPHQPKSEFICESCGLVYQRYELLKEHMISNHSSKASFMCHICNRLYPNRQHLAKHMKRHLSQPKDEDDNFDKDLVKRCKYIKVHPHRPTSNLTCDICKKVLSSYYSMKEHMRSRHSRKAKVKHACSKCKKLFVSKKRLKKHKETKHSDLPAEAVKSKIEKKHICSVCGRLFPDKSKMIAHEKTHFGIMTSCEICNKTFLHKNYLRKHIKSVHARERPFSCNIDGCEWTFAYPQCLKRHQARRHGMVTNRNACPICSKEFPESTYHLKRHLKAHANNTAKEYIPEQKPQPEASPLSK